MLRIALAQVNASLLAGSRQRLDGHIGTGDTDIPAVCLTSSLAQQCPEYGEDREFRM